ncbi:MAG: hypothetical protein R6U32_03585 [Candidatus Woesearchaeota archaeon]
MEGVKEDMDMDEMSYEERKDGFGRVMECALEMYIISGGDDRSKYAMKARIKQAEEFGYSDLAMEYIEKVFSYELSRNAQDSNNPLESCAEAAGIAEELGFHELGGRCMDDLLEHAKENMGETAANMVRHKMRMMGVGRYARDSHSEYGPQGP